MTVFDIVIIVLLVLGLIYGYKYGAFKVFGDFALIYSAMILSSIFNKILSNILIGILPFFNFSGNANGLKSINIILYRVLIFIIFVFIFAIIIDKLMDKFKVKEFLIEKQVEAGRISQIIGAILGVPFLAVISFMILLFLLIPSLNFRSILDSSLCDKVMTNIPIVSSNFDGVYESEKFTLMLINDEEVTEETFKGINKQIINNAVSNGLISKSKKSKLSSKLVGVWKEDKPVNNDDNDNEYNDDEYNDDEYNEDDYGDDEYNEDDYGDDYYDYGEYYGDEQYGDDFDFDEEYSEDYYE